MQSFFFQKKKRKRKKTGNKNKNQKQRKEQKKLWKKDRTIEKTQKLETILKLK